MSFTENLFPVAHKYSIFLTVRSEESVRVTKSLSFPGHRNPNKEKILYIENSPSGILVYTAVPTTSVVLNIFSASICRY